MSLREIRVLYFRELRSALRDRSIVVYSILLPIFLYPVTLWVVFTVMTFVRGLTEGFTSRIALVSQPPASFQEWMDSLSAQPRVQLLRDRAEEEALRALREGKLDAVVEFGPPQARQEFLTDNAVVVVHYDRSEGRSRTALERVETVTSAFRERWIAREAEDLGLDEVTRTLFIVVGENVSSRQEMGGRLLGAILPLFLTIMVALGCFYPAVDATAGERERSTWETLMTTGASRGSVLTAKYLYVATMGAAAGLLNVLAMVASLGAILAPLTGGSQALAFRLSVSSLPVMAVGAVALALLLAAAMMILAAFARNFKEGQAMVQPVYLLAVFLPLLMGQQSDRTLSVETALIPVANVAVLIRDAIQGIFLWPLMGLVLAVNLLLVAACLRLAGTILRFEEVLTGSFDGSFWRFVRARLRRSPSYPPG